MVETRPGLAHQACLKTKRTMKISENLAMNLSAVPATSMPPHARIIVATMLIAGGAAVANPNPDRPSQMEALQLPPYCHKEYGIPSNVPMPTEQCGHLMNHFCKGLVFINRAGDFSAPKGARQQSATRARKNIDYTKRGMPAGCALAGEVNAADTRLRTIEILLK